MTRMNIAKAAILSLVVFLVACAIVAGLLKLLRHGFSARDNPSWLETMAARTARGAAVPANARWMKNPIPNTPDNLAKARAHWADHCATCHGNDGSGETDIGRNLYPKAPDMRLPATQNLTDGEIYYTINNGIRLTGMPAWGQPGESDEDSWRLIYFIRHLPKLTSEEEEEMKKMNPKSPEEWKEEQEEQEFLNQDQPSNPAHEPKHQNH